MAYSKKTWVDQKVERPRTYEMTNNIDGTVTLIDSFGLVSELGTPVNEDNMNHIEEGIAATDVRKHSLTEVFEQDEWVTAIVNGKKGIYQSKQNNNIGHSVLDSNYWGEIDLLNLSVDKINQTKALITGNISSFDEVYADIQKLAHSTFDLSKFSKIGNPIVTDEGILKSNTNNYLTFPFDITGANAVKLEFECFPKKNNTDNDMSGMLFGDNSAPFYIYSNNNALGNFQIDIVMKNSNGAIEQRFNNNVLPSNVHYKFMWELKNEVWSITIENANGYKHTISKAVSEFEAPLKTTGTLQICPKTLNVDFDLKSLSLKVNTGKGFSGNKTGVDVINNIEIPYNLSKTGSKIVDAVYRYRVQDIYEQYGTAMYYTIDEENKNFTLPMGEIYGMIEQKNFTALPIGTEIAVNCSNNYIPAGCLPEDGSEYTAQQFPDLWEKYLITGLLRTCTYQQYAYDITNYGQCAKFAVDVENKKFKMPLKKDGAVTQQALSSAEIGKPYNAGLPNITGTIGTVAYSSNLSGAFYNYTKDSKNISNQGETDYYVQFDASRCSAIYGNSNTVQMNAIALRHFIVVANGEINKSVMDWSQYASNLASKLNKDGLNAEFPYIKDFYFSVTNKSYYIVYSNGYCLQGGEVISSQQKVTVNLLKPYSEAGFVQITTINSANNGVDRADAFQSFTSVSSFTVSHNSAASGFMWEAKGLVTI